MDKVFSPVCRCPQRRASIAFRLRRADRLKLSLLDDEGNEVRTLVAGERAARGPHEFFWNGRDDEGRLMPEGRYRPKVELGRADRTIVLPNPIRVDVTPPVVRVVSVKPLALSPGRRRPRRHRPHPLPGRRARARLASRQRQAARGQQDAAAGWRAPVGRWGCRKAESCRLATYRLAVQARDLAGNLSRRVPAAVVPLRYIRLEETRVSAAPGERAGVGLDTDASRVPWILRRGSSVVQRGVARRVIRLRAPERPGTYVLVATAGGHTARGLVFVRRS